MKRYPGLPFVMLGLCAILAACGPSGTPLVHALSAFRAGDHEALLAAKAEAEDQIKTAVQPGQDLCQVNAADIVKYNARYVIGKLDQPDLFRLPEEDRLLYALKVAGKSAQIQPDSFLTNAPIYQAALHGGEPGGCQRDKMMVGLAAGGSALQDDNEARVRMLSGWVEDMKRKYGDKLDDTMRSAEGHLSNAGYNSSWPVTLTYE